jgi:hypothetical protein
VGLPADIAAQIVVLSSPVLSGHISGQVVMIEGGMEGEFTCILELQSDTQTMFYFLGRLLNSPGDL